MTANSPENNRIPERPEIKFDPLSIQEEWLPGLFNAVTNDLQILIRDPHLTADELSFEISDWYDNFQKIFPLNRSNEDHPQLMIEKIIHPSIFFPFRIQFRLFINNKKKFSYTCTVQRAI